MVSRIWIILVVFVMSAESGARADILFTNGLADDFNGNCIFQCIDSSTFSADNFQLSDESSIEAINFIGIRTGDLPDLDFETTVSVQFYEDDGTWDNSFSNDQFGPLVYSQTGLTATQANVSYPDPLAGFSQAFIEFEIDLPDFDLSAGDYWTALHVDVSGWSGNVGSGDDTSLYWARGQGDGVWAWNYFSPSRDSWSNPNPAITSGGWAFSVLGTNVISTVPEPSTIGLFLIGLVGMGHMMRRRKPE